MIVEILIDFLSNSRKIKSIDIKLEGDEMNKELSKKEFLSISLMLFAMLFGSGNLIFPPMLGNQAANSMPLALMGFSLTAVVFPVLGILAVAKTNGVGNLGKRVGPKFAVLYPAVLFLAIGPGIAIPRNASLAFEMSVAPYLTGESSIILSRLLYTTIFFAIAYYLSVQPGKLVDRIGKLITPILFILIILFFVGGLMSLPVDIGKSTEIYQSSFITGILEGYHTMDILGALNFGLVVTLTIRKAKIKDEERVIKYASAAGLLAGILLMVVYSMLAYIGMISSAGNQAFDNGGQILFYITNDVFGSFGSIILIAIFTLACLTTAVGLITSVSEYFSELTNNKATYQQWIIIYSFISLVFANFGLNIILKFSLPILVAIYPTAIMLIVMALLQERFNFSQLSYKLTIYLTLFISMISAFKSAGFLLPILSDLLAKLPFYEEGLEWLLPAVVIMIISNLFSTRVVETK